jgi:hypothetical protein
VAKGDGHLPIRKGQSARGAPKGNKNHADGPRIGRAHRYPEHRKPGSGKPFKKGENSHDGTVFQRGSDDIPRRNLALFGACVYHDGREMFHRQLLKGAAKDHKYALRVLEWIGHVNGYPKKKDDGAANGFSATFVFTLPDGTQQPALPVGAGRSAGAERDEALILAGQRVVPNGRR